MQAPRGRVSLGLPKNLRHIKDINRKLILRAIWRHPGMSRADLAHVTHLTKTTVSALVAELLAERMVVESGVRSGSVGRKPVGLGINRRYGPFLALDIKPRSLVAGVYDLAGECRARECIEPRPETPEELVRAAASASKKLCPRGEFDHPGVISVAASVPARVDDPHGVVLEAPSLGWHRVELGALLSRAFRGVPHVGVGMDAPLALRAEIWKAQQLEETATAVHLLINESVTAGIALDGKVYPGVDHGAAAFGHMTVSADGPPCGCGRRGCWESYVSVPALIRAWGGAGAEPSDLAGALARLREDFTAGSIAARMALEQHGRWLALGLANIFSAVDPRTIVMGGYLAIVWDLLADAVLAETRRQLAPSGAWTAEREKRIVGSRLPPEDNLEGAAIHALSSIVPFDLFKELVVSSMDSYRKVL